MIYLPELPYCGDMELDKFVRRFINKAISKLILVAIDESQEPGGEDVLAALFPERFPSENVNEMRETLKAIYSLCLSDSEFVPTLIMEYVIAQVIAYGIDCYDLSEEDIAQGKYKHSEQDKSANVPFSEEMQGKLVGAYLKNFDETFGWESSDAEKLEYVQKVVDNLWHFSNEWFEWCFWDCDYMFLDDWDPGELRHSVINAAAGVMSENSDDDAYILPEDWLHSKDFRFVDENKKVC